jgi:hypothetical protein
VDGLQSREERGSKKTPHFRVEVGRVEGKPSVGYCTVTATGAEEIPFATT